MRLKKWMICLGVGALLFMVCHDENDTITVPKQKTEEMKKEDIEKKTEKENGKKENNVAKVSNEAENKANLEETDKNNSKTIKGKLKKKKLKCDFDLITKSIEKYKYYENPYYLDGLEKYIKTLNDIYKEYNSEQQVEIISLDDVLDEIGISSKLQKKILETEGSNILKNSDFVRVDAKMDDGILATFLDSEIQRTYYEVSSLAKDDFIENETVCFYLGELKDNMPEGEGAMFELTDYGARPFYIGKFCEGQYSGYGISFSNDDFASVISDIGNYKENERNGNGISYNVADTSGTYRFYQNAYAKYAKKYLWNYSIKKQEKKVNAFLNNSIMAELFVTVTETLEKKPYKVKVNYPVIKPPIKYEGGQKEGRYHGDGKLYAGLGILWYQGEFLSGDFNGKGTLYYVPTSQIKYQGGFNLGTMHGKGTLYNEDGSVRKKGNFDKEPLSSEDTLMSVLSVSTILNDIYDQVGEKEFFEGKTIEIGTTNIDTDYKEENEYICSNSATKKLTKKEILELSKKERWIAKNEIYARYGRKFNNEELQEYFNSTSWYQGNIEPEDFDESVFSKVEKANIKLFAKYE